MLGQDFVRMCHSVAALQQHNAILAFVGPQPSMLISQHISKLQVVWETSHGMVATTLCNLGLTAHYPYVHLAT